MAITSLLSAVSRRLEGKVALITGGASGIGKRTAEVFAHHGAKLVIADIQDGLGHSVCQSIGAQNDVTYVHCDVTDESQVKAAYTCSKHAVVGLTRNAAVELGQFGIRVNCLSPYGVATPFGREFIGLGDDELEGLFGSFANLKGVTLKAEDVANAALFLASEEGRYVSGHNLVVDGGVTIVNPSFGVFRYLVVDDHHDQA